MVRARQWAGDVTRKQLDRDLGARIRARREALGLSQAALADRVHVTHQMIQKYEKGANQVAFSMLVLLARTLDCSVAELAGERSPERSDAARVLDAILSRADMTGFG